MDDKLMFGRRQAIKGSVVALGGLALSGTAAARRKGARNGRGNSKRSAAMPVEVTSVTAETADPEADNFEEEFTFYTVRFEDVSDVTEYTYREPARLGGNGDVTVGATGSFDSFWFGVSGPGADGVQNEIVHKGQVSIYYETDDGDVRSLVAQFDGNGELRSVNGVTPE